MTREARKAMAHAINSQFDDAGVEGVLCQPDSLGATIHLSEVQMAELLLLLRSINRRDGVPHA